MFREVFHILLIEDNEEHVAFLGQLLAFTEGGPEYKLHSAGSLEEGISRAQQGGIDLILLDLTLPDSEGLESFIRVMEVVPDVAIVVLSGVSDVSLAIEVVQLGAQDYLVKGHVDNHLLVRALRYAIQRKHTEKQLKAAHEELETRVKERTAALQAMNQQLQKEIGERRKAEEEALKSNRQLAEALTQLRSTQQQIIQRERLHALGRMANGIAHDFNNSLAPILGFSELLLMKPDILTDQPKARNYIEMINSAANDSAKVVGRLRDFYRMREEADIAGPVILNDLIQQVVSVTQPRWKDEAQASGVNIAIKTDLGTIPAVTAIESEIREALVNLIFNAIEAIPKRGTVSIKSEIQGPYVTVTVTDDGVGMTEDVRARCLEPFFTTKGEGGANMGLGLGSVFGSVRRHEGDIDIKSASGRGTSVSISLPIEREKKTPQAVLPTAEASKPLRILVVEDEPLVREVLGVYLSEDRHLITTASNGREGLERFRAGEFDLVLTDRAMPEMTGDEMAVEMKKAKPEQPIILLTGYGDVMNGKGERPPGVDYVVSKPFTLNSLRTAIAQALSL